MIISLTVIEMEQIARAVLTAVEEDMNPIEAAIKTTINLGLDWTSECEQFAQGCTECARGMA